MQKIYQHNVQLQQKFRVEVRFKNSLKANQMLKDISLSEKGLKTFVPSFGLIEEI